MILHFFSLLVISVQWAHCRVVFILQKKGVKQIKAYNQQGVLKVQKRFPLKLKRFLKDKLAVRLLYCLNPLAPASTLWCVCCCVVAVLGVFNHRFQLITTVKFNVDFYLTIFVIRLKPIFISGYNREICVCFFFSPFSYIIPHWSHRRISIANYDAIRNV